MRSINTLVIDDEPLARKRIVKLLAQHEEINLMAECKNGSEAIANIQKFRPDLIFLDIQMPDFNGFEVIDAIAGYKPFIIFITAFDEYALKAFDVKATDYLLKPFDDERFNEALNFAKNQIQTVDKITVHDKMVRLVNEHQALSKVNSRPIVIKEKIGITKIPPEGILYLEADGNYVKIYTGERRFMHRSTLHELHDQLPEGLFFQIHRSIIVNIKSIVRVTYKSNNQFIFQMSNNKNVLSSRGYRDSIKDFLDLHTELV